MFSVATVFLLLASLIAAAGFAVVAQRRLRQLGMLAAIGATQKHLRLVLIANGAIVGAIAAVCGTIAGLALWLAVAPTLESAVGHRIDRLSLPWGLIATAVALAVVAATAAAWWPARTVARVPVMLALSGRPPKPRPARHAAIAAAALIALGIGCLALSDRDRAPLIVAGILATILGTLLLGPLAIRIVLRGRRAPLDRAAPGAARPRPLPGPLRSRARRRHPRARHRGDDRRRRLGRGGEGGDRAAEPVRPADPRLHRPGGGSRRPRDRGGRPGRPPGRARLTARGALEQATVIALRKAHQPGEAALVVGDTRVRPTIDLARRIDRRLWRPESQLYVATPAMLSYLGIDPATVDPGTDFLADPGVPTDRLGIPKPAGTGRSPSRTSSGSRSAAASSATRGVPARRKPTFITLAVFAAMAGSRSLPAGSSSPRAVDERPDRRRPRARRGRRPHARGPTRSDLARRRDGHRDGRGRPPGARHPRADGRADPQRERRLTSAP